MLAKSLIDEINHLLKQSGMSQRKIAAKLHVSRGTVSAIANGRRGLYGRDAGDEEPSSLRPLSPPDRCPCCGYRVYLPCLICLSRDFQQRQAELRIASMNTPNPAESGKDAPTQRKPDGTKKAKGKKRATDEKPILPISRTPCLPLYKTPTGMPFLTLIPAVACTSA